MFCAEKADFPIDVIEEYSAKFTRANNYWDFILKRAFGFNQPVAKTIALLTPIHFAVVLYLSDFQTLIQVSVYYGISVSMFILGLWYISRNEIKNSYLSSIRADNSRVAHLVQGGALSEKLVIDRNVYFLKHNQGVIVITEIDNASSVIFLISKSCNDARWQSLLNEELAKSEWSWLRLLGTGQVCHFKTSGKPISEGQITNFYISEKQRAILLGRLGNPADGDVLNCNTAGIEGLLSKNN